MSDKSYALSVVGTLEAFFEYGCNIFATGYQPRSDLWQAFNACTETLYTGGDAITLAHGMEECDYRQNLWISRGQIAKHGLSLKDSHNSFGFLVSAPDPELEHLDSKKFTPYHLVYNIENLEGLTPQAPIASLINLDFSDSSLNLESKNIDDEIKKLKATVRTSINENELKIHMMNETEIYSKYLYKFLMIFLKNLKKLNLKCSSRQLSDKDGYKIYAKYAILPDCLKLYSEKILK